MNNPGVSVVVPTLNRGGFLLPCLADLLAQRHRPLEILVVDQSESVGDDLARLVEQNRNIVSHHRVPFRCLPTARNFGWQKARYDALIFVDDDTRCGPDLVSEHLRALSLPGVGLVAGGLDTPSQPRPDLHPRPGTYRPWTASPLRGFASTGQGDADHAAGGNFSAWRHALARAGGFDEALGRGAALYEETDLCLRVRQAGFRVYFQGQARLTHLTAPTGGCRVDRVPDYVKSLAHNRAVMIRRHGRWFHAPFALGRLAALGLSYARHYRVPSALGACLSGGFRGLLAGSQTPVCTRFSDGGPA